MAPLAPPGYAYALPPPSEIFCVRHCLLPSILPIARIWARLFCWLRGWSFAITNQLQNPVTILPETTCETPSFNLSFALNVTFSIYCTLILSIPIDLCHLVFSFMRLQNI